MRILLFLSAFLLASCSKPRPTPQAELARIVATPKSPAWTGTVVSVRTEPTTTPSHSAIVEATERSDVHRFTVFYKDGIWYYDQPISIISEGERIYAFDISNTVSQAARQFDFQR